MKKSGYELFGKRMTGWNVRHSGWTDYAPQAKSVIVSSLLKSYENLAQEKLLHFRICSEYFHSPLPFKKGFHLDKTLKNKPIRLANSLEIDSI